MSMNGGPRRGDDHAIAAALVIATLGVLTAGMAASMARNGPITRTTIPFAPPDAQFSRPTMNRKASAGYR